MPDCLEMPYMPAVRKQAADTLYHMTDLMAEYQVSWEDVTEEIDKREKKNMRTFKKEEACPKISGRQEKVDLPEHRPEWRSVSGCPGTDCKNGIKFQGKVSG